MVNCLYIESSVRHHPRTLEIIKRFKQVPVIDIDHYGEVFNPRSQNFRVQKSNPSLILAHKVKNHALATPAGYGLDGEHHYYFSHMLNCVYDCRYCFLQGMFQSANQIIFVNFEDFMEDIRRVVHHHKDQPVWFYSGYDCDSLAFDPVTGFSEFFIPEFTKIPNAKLELRTKSTQIRKLLDLRPADNIIVAFSFSDEHSHQHLEHGVPPIQKRLEVMKKLAQAGWTLGLRFDPLVYHDNYRTAFEKLLIDITSAVDPGQIHSLSLGTFRLTRNHYRKMVRLYPEEPLFAQDLALNNGIVSYRSELEDEMIRYCENLLKQYFPEDIYYPCEWHD